jgi:hypothetical protein
LWFLRLFILPHTLAGIWFILMIPMSLAWAAFGRDEAAEVLSVRTGTSKGKAYQYAKYRFMAGGDWREGEVRVSNGFANAAEAALARRGDVAERVTVPVRWIGVGRWAYHEALPEGASVAWRVVRWWLIAAFWNGILSVFLYQAYVRPWRERRRGS